MKHVYALLVPNPNICSVFVQQFDELDVAVEAGEVHGIEAFFRAGWRIDPFGDCLSDLLLN